MNVLNCKQWLRVTGVKQHKAPAAPAQATCLLLITHSSSCGEPSRSSNQFKLRNTLKQNSPEPALTLHLGDFPPLELCLPISLLPRIFSREHWRDGETGSQAPQNHLGTNVCNQLTHAPFCQCQESLRRRGKHGSARAPRGRSCNVVGEHRAALPDTTIAEICHRFLHSSG